MKIILDIKNFLIENLKNRFILFLVFVFVFPLINYYLTGQALPSTKTEDLWFYSGLVMLLVSILFIEPYYSSPKNVITNSIPLVLVLLSVKENISSAQLWNILFFGIFTLLLTSIASLFLNDENKSPEYWKNQLSNFLKNIVTLFGKGKHLYSFIFFVFLYINFQSNGLVNQEIYFIFLLIVWAIVIGINPNDLKDTFTVLRKRKSEDEIGSVFGVQSKRMFLVRLYEDRKSIKKFDVVKFRYSMQDSDKYLMTGIIFDTYLLNEEKWAKVLQIGHIQQEMNTDKNAVFKITNEEKLKLEEELRINSFVGVIDQKTDIGKIIFEYSQKNSDLQEGDLLELTTQNKRVFYQVINGLTEIENLDGRNESGYTRWEAIQLGTWDSEKLSFQKFWWLPEINTPVFKAKTDDLSIDEFVYPEYQLGVVPNTNLPSIINLDEAVSHHMALLGVTGSGKSFLAREIIRELTLDTKIIIVDFTGEWEKELKELDIECMGINGGNIDDFLNNDQIGIVSMNSTSNTSQILEQTQKFLEKVFDHAKEKYAAGEKRKVCLVLEEAHTITPETSFLGDFGDYSANKALVNKMWQIALQGRKYGVGLLMIAQRTANVSKTMLTQCNTVICFQAFDETSFNFLGNYIGKDLVNTLPNLKPYHAIVTWKAVKANIPMIINLYREKND